MFKDENNKHCIICKTIISLTITHIFDLAQPHHKSVQMSLILHTMQNEAALSYGEVTGFYETMAVTKKH